MTVAATIPKSKTPADDAPHLLVVDDDRRIRSLLSRFLQGEGYRVTVAESAADARAKLTGLHFDLLILDVMMPGESGFDLVKAIRITSPVPVLMLTARDEAENRITGLELGADDYVTKPFEPRELSLRISNILKRAQPPAPPPAAESLRFGPFVYHLARGELRKGDEIIHLTDREREMLRILAVSPGEPVHLHVDGALARRCTVARERQTRNRLARRHRKDAQ
ncbi:MAG TPA: response regulator transcription factor, partial [Xanthobacteraceae bacterium]|nr:response regulator transcription factor [Xanthobacteraceae bacterium]